MGSSKLKIKNIVNFSWEHKYSHGEVNTKKNQLLLDSCVNTIFEPYRLLPFI